MFWLAVAVALFGVGIAAIHLLLYRLAASVRLTLSETEKLRSQTAEALKSLTMRAQNAEAQAESLSNAHRKLIEANTLLGSDDHRREVEYLRGQNAHLTSALYESAHTAQRRILELVSPPAAEGERRAIPGYKPPFEDGFRAFPPESSPVDTIRYPEASRTVKTSTAPQEPEPQTTEAAPYSQLQPFPPAQDFSALADVDEVFKS